MTIKRAYLRFVATAIILVANASFGGEIEKSFTGIKAIEIRLTSGDCAVEGHAGDKVEVRVTFSYHEEDYRPEIMQRGDRLRIEESFRGRHNRGEARWHLRVPEAIDLEVKAASSDIDVTSIRGDIRVNAASGDMRLSRLEGEVDINSASGDIDAEALSGRIQINTASGAIGLKGGKGTLSMNAASGNIRTSDFEGDVEAETASGDIRINNTTGTMRASAASGDLEMRQVQFNDRTELTTASGDIEIALAGELKHDLILEAASGDLRLGLEKNRLAGTLEVTAPNRMGNIRAPFEFDTEDTYFKSGREYVTKRLERGPGPAVRMSTASGRVVISE